MPMGMRESLCPLGLHKEISLLLLFVLGEAVQERCLTLKTKRMTQLTDVLIVYGDV